jgi:undecaprenyl-diphosphatase
MSAPGQLVGWDVWLFHAFNRDLGSAVDAAVRFFDSPRSAVVCTVLLAAFCLWRLRGRAAPVMLAAVLAAVATDVVGARVLKRVVSRTRPCYALPAGTVRQVVPVANSGALPSLHAANWFAAVTPVAIAVPAAAPALFGLALAVGLSRVVGGVHWPSDVLAGSALGLGMGLLATWLVRSLVRRRRRRDRTVPAAESG